MVFHFREEKKGNVGKKSIWAFFLSKRFQRLSNLLLNLQQIQLEEHIHFICKHCYTNHFTCQEIRSILFLHISTQVHFFCHQKSQCYSQSNHTISLIQIHFV